MAVYKTLSDEIVADEVADKQARASNWLPVQLGHTSLEIDCFGADTPLWLP